MSTASSPLPRRLLTLGLIAAGLIAAGLCAASSASAAGCTAGTWVARSNEAGMPAVRYETTHFAFRWNGDGVSAADVRAAGEHLEMVWDTFINRLQFPEPACTSTTKYKASIHLDPSFGLSGGITGSGGMGMWMAPAGLRDHWGLAHELTHALQGQTQGLRDSPYTGWIWESHANWMTHQLPEFHSSEVHCSNMLVNYPHIYLGSTRDRYCNCNWQFMEYLKNRYGYAIINDMWAKAPKPGDPAQRSADPFTVIRTNMGWTQSQLNDVFGDWALRNVNWEYTNPDGSDQGVLYRARYGSNLSFDPQRTQDWYNRDRALRMTVLDPVDGQANRYRVPFEWAPQRWGYNLVQLIPTAGATSLKVAFQGQVQTAPAVTALPGLANDPDSIPAPDSDWRWSVVAIDSSGRARYSALQRGAEERRPCGLPGGDGRAQHDAEDQMGPVLLRDLPLPVERHPDQRRAGRQPARRTDAHSGGPSPRQRRRLGRQHRQCRLHRLRGPARARPGRQRARQCAHRRPRHGAGRHGAGQCGARRPDRVASGRDDRRQRAGAYGLHGSGRVRRDQRRRHRAAARRYRGTGRLADPGRVLRIRRSGHDDQPGVRRRSAAAGAGDHHPPGRLVIAIGPMA
ncbi:avirulence protein [Xanthomonas citri pv. malvacearum str. GSPB1386]|nr:avirulence protein [Xanthomonas citri pv. malvacearum str. GSPB1386]